MGGRVALADAITLKRHANDSEFGRATKAALVASQPASSVRGPASRFAVRRATKWAKKLLAKRGPPEQEIDFERRKGAPLPADNPAGGGVVVIGDPPKAQC